MEITGGLLRYTKISWKLKATTEPTLRISSGFCKRILETGEVHFFSRQSNTSITQLKHERRYVRDKYCCGYKYVLYYSLLRRKITWILLNQKSKKHSEAESCSTTRNRSQKFGRIRVAILGWFMAGFSLLFNYCSVRSSSLMMMSWKYLNSLEFQIKGS